MNLTFLYVAALYFGGVWIWRRWGTPFPWKVAGLFYLLVLLFQFHPLVLSYTRLPVDHVLGMYPWRGYYDVDRARNPETNDVILQMVPWAHQVRESWKRFEPPLWNEAAGGGYPLLANGQSGGLSAIRLLSLPLPLAQSMASESALKILIALSFAYLYMRRRGRSEAASIITAVSYAFSTFITVWLHFGHSSVAAFLPAVFLSVDLLVERRSFRRVVFTAFVFAMLLLHGHPETAAHIMLVAGIYTLFQILSVPIPWRERMRGIGGLVIAGVLSILLALPFLLPFIEALPRSQRYQLLQVNPPEIVSVSPRYLVPFIQPSFYGHDHSRNTWGPGIAELVCGYAGILGVAGWLALLFQRIKERTWRDPVSFYVLATPVLVTVVMGWAGLSQLLHSLPLYEMAANGRLRVAICWFLAVLAGEAVHHFLMRRDRKPLLFGLGTVAALLIILFAATRFPNELRLASALETTWPRAAVLIAAAILIFSSETTRRWTWGLLVAAISFDLWMFAWPWYPMFPAKHLYPVTPLIAELQRVDQIEGAVAPQRITGTTAALFPNTPAMYGLEDIRAHDPMAFGRVLGALRVYTGYTSEKYFGFLSSIDDPFLDYLNVRYVVSAPPEDYRSDRFVQIYSGADGRIFRNRDALPRFYAARNVFSEFDDVKRTQRILEHRDWVNSVWLKRLPSRMIDQVRQDLFNPRPSGAPMATVRIVSAKPTEFRLSTDAPRWTLIISSQPNWPGWKIYSGSERLKQIEVNETFMGFLVPPGHSDIRVVYAPRSFSGGAAVSLLTIVLLAAFPLGRRIYNRMRERRAREAHP